MKKLLLSSVIFISGIAIIGLLTALMYPSGSPAGYTGSPGDGHNCTSCHSGTAQTVSGWITSNIPTEGYTAGSSYTITVTVSGSGNKGFEVSPQSLAGSLLGTLTAGSGTQLTGSNKYVTQSATSSANPKIWTFTWTSPAAGTGSVTFYGAFCAGEATTKLSTMIVNELAAVPSVTTGTVAGNPFCTGETVSIPFTKTGTFVTGNVFTAQLSGATGSFSNPVAIGTLNGTSAGSVTAIIPLNIPPGNTYRVRVISSNPALTGTDNGINLTVNASPVMDITATTIVCNGDTAVVSVTATGGHEPYTGTGDFSTIAGSVNYSITDANSCIDDTVVIVTEPPAIEVTAEITNATGVNTYDGIIDITTTGGTSPYTFNWSNGFISEDPAYLAPGFYSVTTTDANDCTSEATFEVMYINDVIRINKENCMLSISPNPVKDDAIIELRLTEPCFVELSIYNIFGEKIETLLSENAIAGNHSIHFDSGSYSEGTYFYCLTSGETNLLRTISIIR